MKTLILILVCFCLHAQNKFTFTGSVNIFNDATFIHLKISPTIQGDGFQFEDYVKAHFTIEDYDNFVRSARFDSVGIASRIKYIPVQSEIRGKTINYSFNQFRELIWPTPKRRSRYEKS